jgi:tRNA-2-methylthio-N6-dimethylallyladenosine synthase
LQSGSDRVLARMHRGYNRSRYEQKLAMARESIPGLAISTDVIVGFPGETEDDFDLTLEVVEAARFDQAFMFIFSPRPGTAAAQMVDDFVPDRVIQERFARLAGLQNRVSLELNQATVGRHLEVLSEGPSRKDPAVTTARSRTGKVVHVNGVHRAGTFLEVGIVSAAPHHLVGSLR